jgi:threonine dehydratase
MGLDGADVDAPADAVSLYYVALLELCLEESIAATVMPVGQQPALILEGAAAAAVDALVSPRYVAARGGRGGGGGGGGPVQTGPGHVS